MTLSLKFTLSSEDDRPPSLFLGGALKDTGVEAPEGALFSVNLKAE